MSVHFASMPTHDAAADHASALDPLAVSDFGRRLRAWYRRSARDLPWRRTRDAYRILVSELLLQQTQVSRVVPKYHEFLKTFPTLAHVARATPDRVMEAWSGLGYYARARNLHKLALHVTSDGTRRRAKLPSEAHELRALPGIGAYTAGAVASFAYGKRAALVDTNVARVLSRVFAPALSPKRARDLTAIWRIAERSLPRTGTATWTHNQALMELGALVCTARVAHCDRCPVRPVCATAAASRTR
jgi:A/G-specific adenine glycosylase